MTRLCNYIIKHDVFSNLSKDICSARRLLNENPLQTSFTSPDGEMCILDDSDEITVRIQYQGEIRRFAMNSVSFIQGLTSPRILGRSSSSLKESFRDVWIGI